jgi:hypothetical protein
MVKFDGIKSVLMVVFKVYLVKRQQTFQNLIYFRFQQKYKKFTDLMSPPGLTIFFCLYM